MRMLSAILALALTAIGCSSRDERQRVSLLAGIDTSGSFRSERNASVDHLRLAVEQLQRGVDSLRVFRFDRDAYEIFSEVPASSQQFVDTLVAEVSADPEERGTLPAKLLDALANAAAASDGAVILYIYTDGGNDDLAEGSKDRFMRAGRKLAACDRVQSVNLIGVRAGWREVWRTALKELGPQLRFVDGDAPDLRDALHARGEQ